MATTDIIMAGIMVIMVVIIIITLLSGVVVMVEDTEVFTIHGMAVTEEAMEAIMVTMVTITGMEEVSIIHGSEEGITTLGTADMVIIIMAIIMETTEIIMVAGVQVINQFLARDKEWATIPLLTMEEMEEEMRSIQLLIPIPPEAGM
jgi:hypothetical protein